VQGNIEAHPSSRDTSHLFYLHITMCYSTQTLNVGGIIFTKQLYSDIHMILKFVLRTQDATSSLLQASYKAMKELGHTTNIFDCPTCMQPCLTDSWITHTWEACHHASIRIVAKTSDFHRTRENNVELMRLTRITQG